MDRRLSTHAAVALVAMIAIGFALLGQAWEFARDYSSVGGVALSGISGLCVGLLAWKKSVSPVAWGAAAGFANAFAGILTSVLVRDASVWVLVLGPLGGAVIGGAMGALAGWVARTK